MKQATPILSSEVQSLIGLVNALEAEAIEEITRVYSHEKLNTGRLRDDIPNLVSEYKRILSKYPKLMAFIGVIDEVRFPELNERLRVILTANSLLRGIARTNRAESGNPLSYYSFHSDLIRFEIDKNGIIEIIKEPLLGQLEGVDAERILECPVCNKIFWARRSDQQCCNQECARTLRTRRWRGQVSNDIKLPRSGSRAPEGGKAKKQTSPGSVAKAPGIKKGK